MRGATFIYPVHNRSAFMLRTLSALSEFDIDWSESEVLVIDDASTDGLREKCEAMAGKVNLRVVDYDSSKHPLAGGATHPFIPVASINEGVRQANCEQVILSCPEVTPIKLNDPDTMQRFINRPIIPRQVILGMVFDQNVQGIIDRLVHPTRFWPFLFFGKLRREDWLAVGGYPEEYLPYVSCADAEMDLKLNRLGWTYLFLGEPILLHRFHGRSDFSQLPEKSRAAEDFFKKRVREAA